MVGSVIGWKKVEKSGGKRGGAKTSEKHPGWFHALGEPLGFSPESTKVSTKYSLSLGLSSTEARALESTKYLGIMSRKIFPG